MEPSNAVSNASPVQLIGCGKPQPGRVPKLTVSQLSLGFDTIPYGIKRLERELHMVFSRKHDERIGYH